MTPITEIRAYEEHLAGLPASRCRVTRIAPGIVSLNQAPRFILGAFPPELALAMLGELEIGAIDCAELEGLAVGPDGLLMDGPTALFSGALNLPDYHVRELLNRITRAPAPRTTRHVPGTAVWLCGPGYHIYGHWLVDFLPRLLVIQRAGFDLARVSYLVSGPGAEFVDSLLHAFGIRPDQIVRFDNQTEVLTTERLVVATNLRQGMRLHPLMSEASNFLLERAVQVTPAILDPWPDGRRLFISRNRTEQSRVAVNRALIERIAEDAGFSIVRPEEHSFPDQIRLFRNAHQVAGEYGSGLHGVLFAPAGTVTCALRSGSSHPGFIQTSISDVRRQCVGYVLGSNALDAVDQSFEVSDLHWRTAIKCMNILAAGADRGYQA